MTKAELLKVAEQTILLRQQNEAHQQQIAINNEEIARLENSIDDVLGHAPVHRRNGNGAGRPNNSASIPSRILLALMREIGPGKEFGFSDIQRMTPDVAGPSLRSATKRLIESERIIAIDRGRYRLPSHN